MPITSLYKHSFRQPLQKRGAIQSLLGTRGSLHLCWEFPASRPPLLDFSILDLNERSHALRLLGNPSLSDSHPATAVILPRFLSNWARCVSVHSTSKQGILHTKLGSTGEPSESIVLGLPRRATTPGPPSRAATLELPSRAATPGQPRRAAKLGPPSRAATLGQPRRAATLELPSRSEL
eukprot:365993-Chlamydomonas_euryale.AAC.2